MKKNSRKSLLKNERGQFVIEAVLLMVVSVSILLFGIRYMKENRTMATLVSGPWEKTAGMIESGVWKPAEEAAKKHPNQTDRGLSLDPK
jgi:hypothetical protein